MVSPSLFSFIFVFSNNVITIFKTKYMRKIVHPVCRNSSIQYAVVGFEPTTLRTWFSTNVMAKKVLRYRFRLSVCVSEREREREVRILNTLSGQEVKNIQRQRKKCFWLYNKLLLLLMLAGVCVWESERRRSLLACLWWEPASQQYMDHDRMCVLRWLPHEKNGVKKRVRKRMWERDERERERDGALIWFHFLAVK